jgi:molybdopterin synthase catalytic subunit
MTVLVRLFAAARDAAGGAGRLDLDLPDEATVGDAWTELGRRFPRLAAFPLQGLAVNRDYAETEQPLADGDELAVIPPVSGG